VLNRLIPHSGLPAETNNWEVHVIKDEQKNAFVIPGGKVFVFSGILDICQGEPGLSAVLGHEIAHVSKQMVQKQRGSLVDSTGSDEIGSRTPSRLCRTRFASWLAAQVLFPFFHETLLTVFTFRMWPIILPSG
jgi:predicted Zn-dependent protease